MIIRNPAGAAQIPQTNYTRGRSREYKVIEMLRQQGYYATRSAGSHGLFDVIAIGPHDFLLIQVKLECKPTSQERQALEEFQAPPNAFKELWVFRNRMKPTIERLN